MGKTSSTVKDRYNAKTYDALQVRMPKGMKQQFASACKAHGDGCSMNGVITRYIAQFISETQMKNSE